MEKDLDVGLQGGGVHAANSGSAGETDLSLLHSELETLLDDHAEPFGLSNACRRRPFKNRAPTDHLVPDRAVDRSVKVAIFLSNEAGWPDLADILLALMVRPRVIRSCGLGSPDLPTSSLGSMPHKLGVIESLTGRLP